MGSSTDPQGTNAAMPTGGCAWHRAYVLELEHQLQAAINDKNFRLPYWDYLDAGQPQNPRRVQENHQPALRSEPGRQRSGFEMTI